MYACHITFLFAENGDFVPVMATLVFETNESTKSIAIAIVDDRVLEGEEDFLIRLATPSDGAVLGSDTQVFVGITDNDCK